MDSTAPMEESDREYELEMELLKRRIASKDSDRMFLWSLMRAAAKRDEGWESAAKEPVSYTHLTLPTTSP